jgi:arabinoxylan arabinofuranohydrolase
MKTSINIFILVFLLGTNACLSPDSIKLNKVAFMLSSGEISKLQAFDTLSGRSVNVQWQSSNPAVARVGDDGSVRAFSAGDAIITALLPKSGAEATCRVSVDALPQNPVLPPSWERYIPDPEPKVFEGKVYVYGSMDVDNGVLPTGVSWCSDRYHAIYSEDLVHWTDGGISFHLDWIPAEYKTPETTRLWAPDALRHPVTGKYYLYACFNQKKGGFITVSVSDNPGGPFLDAVPLMIDGRAYVTWPFKMGQLDPEDYARILGNTVVDVSQWMPKNNPPFEGPSLRKRGDTYYYIYIQNDGPIDLPDGTQNRAPTRMAYMTSKNPLGPYEYRGLIIATSDYPGVINVHGSMVEFEGDWYLFYHLPVTDKRLTRVMCMDRLEFRPDGSIVEVKPTSSGIRDAFRPGDRIQASSAVIYPGGDLNPAYVSRKGAYPKLVFSEPGSHAGYRYVDLTGLAGGALTTFVKTQAEGAVMEFRFDGPDGPLLTEMQLPDTGGDWREITGEFISPAGGDHTLYVRLRSKPENGPVEIDWFLFAIN